MTLDPVSVEITYGIERIMMALQGVSHFKDIAYAPGISYGEVFGQAEYEMSRYYLDDADVESQKRLFEEYANEARRMIDDAAARCPRTSCVLQLLAHVQRARRPRRRQHDGTRQGVRPDADPGPRGRRGCGPSAATELEHPLGDRRAARRRRRSRPSSRRSAGPGTLTFEIGTEEMPPSEVTKTAEAVRDRAHREAGRDAARPRRHHDVRDAAPGGRVRRRCAGR